MDSNDFLASSYNEQTDYVTLYCNMDIWRMNENECGDLVGSWKSFISHNTNPKESKDHIPLISDEATVE